MRKRHERDFKKLQVIRRLVDQDDIEKKKEVDYFHAKGQDQNVPPTAPGVPGPGTPDVYGPRPGLGAAKGAHM